MSTYYIEARKNNEETYNASFIREDSFMAALEWFLKAGWEVRAREIDHEVREANRRSSESTSVQGPNTFDAIRRRALEERSREIEQARSADCQGSNRVLSK